MGRMRYDVFLSYRRADTAVVLPLRDELRRLGYRVFFDTQSIEGGDDWKKRLQTAISESRTLVLCWSASASESAVVTFEYSSARALGKTVVPWLLDATPLPVMLDQLNGITTTDAVQAAEKLRPILGWTLGARRGVQGAIAAVLAVAIAVGGWLALRPAPPPPPWEFTGTVVDTASGVGIADVQVEATPKGATAAVTTHTDAEGRYALKFPQPQPATIFLEFTHAGYTPDKDWFSANKPLKENLTKLP